MNPGVRAAGSPVAVGGEGDGPAAVSGQVNGRRCSHCDLRRLLAGAQQKEERCADQLSPVFLCHHRGYVAGLLRGLIYNTKVWSIIRLSEERLQQTNALISLQG